MKPQGSPAERASSIKKNILLLCVFMAPMQLFLFGSSAALLFLSFMMLFLLLVIVAEKAIEP